MKKKFTFWLTSAALFFSINIAPLSAHASPIILKELTGVKLSSVLQQAFLVQGTLLTMAQQSFVVINPAICYGAEIAKICRVGLGYQHDSPEASSFTKTMTLTYQRTYRPSKALTIISAIEYFTP